MRTSNPALSDNTFFNQSQTARFEDTGLMTIEGTVAKSAFLLAICTLTALALWFVAVATSTQVLPNGQVIPNQAIAYPAMIAGGVGGLIMAIVTMFKKNLAAFTGTLYVVFEGLVIGGLSAIAEAYYPGIALQAGLLTFGTLFTMLTAYRTGLIKVTDRLRSIIVAATGGIMLVYLASFVMSFFGASIPFIHEGGMIGIGFSLFVVGLAAFNLLLDFDFIERGSKQGAPKHMEWYAAFGLMVTLIWLYIEILRLLMKLQSRD